MRMRSLHAGPDVKQAAAERFARAACNAAYGVGASSEMSESFAKICKPYSVLFLDAYGVLKTSQGVIDGVPDVLAQLKAAGKEIFVVTNDASRSPDAMAEAYSTTDGEPVVPPEHFVSSGMLAGNYLSSHVPYGKVAFLGKPGSIHYIEMAGFIPVPISECEADDRLVAIALLDDEGFDWFVDINAALNLVRQTEVPVIVANADAMYPLKGNRVAVAVGSLGTLLSSITEREFIRFGKPDASMFAYAYNRALELKPDLKKSDILFVGDTLRTDILGANDFGIDSALVLSGNTLPQTAMSMIDTTGIRPTHICDSITT